MSTDRFWVIYDGRACQNRGTDRATVFVCAKSEQEAEEDCTHQGTQCAAYSYKERGDKLLDERWEFDTDGYGKRIKK